MFHAQPVQATYRCKTPSWQNASSHGLCLDLLDSTCRVLLRPSGEHPGALSQVHVAQWARGIYHDEQVRASAGLQLVSWLMVEFQGLCDVHDCLQHSASCLNTLLLVRLFVARSQHSISILPCNTLICCQPHCNLICPSLPQGVGGWLILPEAPWFIATAALLQGVGGWLCP